MLTPLDGVTPSRRPHLVPHRRHSPAGLGLGPGARGPAAREQWGGRWYRPLEPFGAQDLGLRQPPRPYVPLGHHPGRPTPAPEPQKGSRGSVSPHFTSGRASASGPVSGHSLAPRTPPRGLLACPGGAREAEKTNRAGAEAGTGAGWGLEGSAQCGQSGEQSPLGSPVTAR